MNRVIVGLGAVFFASALAFGAGQLTSVNARAAAGVPSAQPTPAEQPATTPVGEPPTAVDPAPVIDVAPAAIAPAVQPPAPQPMNATTIPGPAASIGPMQHIVQTLNNCGPASVAEVLDHWSINKTQGELAFLRHGDPIGMNSDNVAAYLPTIGMRELVANQGSQDIVKAFIANGFPVIVSQFVSLGDRYDHFRPIEAYDDGGRYFVADDPLLGDGHRISYAEFDQIWGRYDRFFMVIFPPSKQDLVNGVLKLTRFDGPSWMTPA